MRLTYNNLKNWHRTSQLLPLLYENKRQKYYNFKFGEHICGQPWSNILYSHIGKEMERTFGVREFKYYGFFDLSMNELADRDGVYHIYIHVSFWQNNLSLSYSIRFMTGEINDRFWPNSNREITPETIVDEIRKHYEKTHLYPKGMFRNIQQLHGVNKKRALLIHERWAKNRITPMDWEHDQGVAKSILKRYRCTNYAEDMTAQEFAIKARDVWQSRKHTTPLDLKKFNPWTFLDDSFDGDIDEAESILLNAIHENQEQNILLV